MTDSTGILTNTQAVVGDDGSVRLKNISSGGIDFDNITKALVTAKRSPAIKIEKDIKENNAIISDFQTLNTSTRTLGNTLESLRGSNSSFTKDVFDQRSGTVQTRPTSDAPANHTSSGAGDIVSIAVEENAVKGTHTIEVLQKASAHQVRSDSVSEKHTDISKLTPPLPTGTFSINNKEINVTESDSIYEIAEKINNANKGSDATNVTATIVSASDNEHYLVLSSDKTGTDNNIKFGLKTGSEAESLAVLNGLGLTTGTNAADLAIKNETTASQNAKLDVNGLGIVIERQSNTIDDVIDGISLDIVKAEPNTVIELEIKSDLTAVKQGIIDFVDAYNETRKLVNGQQESKPRQLDEDGKIVEGAPSEFGELAFDSTFRQFSQEFTKISAFSNLNLEEGFQSLSQIGIKVDKDGMLQIDNKVLDKRIVDDVDQIEKLFSFNMTASDSNVSYITNTADTQPNIGPDGLTKPYYLTIQGTDADGNITGASLRTGPGESDFIDGSVTITGNVLTFTDKTGAEGLKIIYNGGPNLSQVNDIEITPNRGLADTFFHTQKNYSNTKTGQFDKKITSFESQNKENTKQVDNIDTRVDRFEKMIKAKFLKTEQAMSKSDSLLKQLEKQFDAMNKS